MTTLVAAPTRLDELVYSGSPERPALTYQDVTWTYAQRVTPSLARQAGFAPSGCDGATGSSSRWRSDWRQWLRCSPLPGSVRCWSLRTLRSGHGNSAR